MSVTYAHPWPPRILRGIARALMTAGVDLYEDAIRGVTERERRIAASIVHEPTSALVRAWADLTRDATAVQLSTLRWILDL